MNVYILDYNGTLTSLRDPHGYVRALQHLGHKVVIWSGSMLYDQPKLVGAVDWFFSKSSLLREVVGHCVERWSDYDTIYVSDDDQTWVEENVLDIATAPGTDVRIEYLHPRWLNDHLGGLAPKGGA